MKGTSKNKLGKIEKNAKIKEGICIFPFKYKWKTHDTCVETEKGTICATEINKDTRTLTKYGYCKPVVDEPEIIQKSKSPIKSPLFTQKRSTRKESIKKKTNKRIKIKMISPSPLSLKSSPKLSKKLSSEKTKKKKKNKKLLLIEEPYLMEEESKKKKKKKKGKKLKLELIETEFPNLKISQELIKKDSVMPISQPKEHSQPKGYNEEFIEILGELKDIMQAQGEIFRAKAYQTAQETIMLYEGVITSPEQLKGMKGIGETILSKLNEYVTTGTLRALEKGRKDPIIVLTKVYGIGPKKAKDLISQGITSIEKLRENKNILNDVQQIGLNYYEDILEKIPRSEIDEYKIVFDNVINSINIEGSKYEIVGSYRRGKQISGDIDVIITNENDNKKIFDTFIDELKDKGILIEILTRGKSKSLTISKLPGKVARRIDFLYTSPEEYPFAVLYFTGSKIFNTVMRQRAITRGFTLNEHGMSIMKKGVKGEKVSDIFTDEKAIFDFLDMEYKLPEERIDGRAVQNKKLVEIVEESKLKETKEIIEEQKKELIDEKNKEDTKDIKENDKAKKREKPEKIKKNKTLKIKKTKVIDLLKQFKEQGVSGLKLLSEEELSALIKYANDAYYCKSDPVMTDNQYDILREYTLEIFPLNDIAKEGHAGCEMEIQRNKVTLPYEMWSMDKIKPDTEALQKWISKFSGPYVISCKLDGVSGLYVTEGNTSKLYTRGNGIVGQDISHLIPYLRLPKTKNIAIRGEFIVSKNTFKEKFASQFANPRNFVAGVINQKKINPDVISSLSFVAYEVINPELIPSEQMKKLESLDVEVVKYIVNNSISNASLSETLIEWRNEYEYEIDGIICIDNKIYPRISGGNPEHAFAFKMVLSEQVAEAKVMDVLWSPSKDGLLKPRVQIEPITLGGVRIEFATGFNAKFIEDNNIGLGALIQIVRSGDVIPHILAVTSPADKPLMPTIPYEWNETHVDIILTDKEENVVVKEKVIELFFSKIDVEGLKIGKVKKLVAAGYDSVPKILKMTPVDYEKIEGFGKKSSLQIANNIKEKVDQSSLIKIMVASNFARGMGEKKLGPILDAYPNILTGDVSDNEKIKLIQSVKGVAENSAIRFVSNIKDFLDFLEETGLQNKLGKVEEKNAVVHDHPLFGKKIIMTGFRDADLENTLIQLGADLTSSVSKNTFVVLVKDLDETTGKAEKARKLGIPLMTPEEFKTKYDL